MHTVSIQLESTYLSIALNYVREMCSISVWSVSMDKVLDVNTFCLAL